MDGQAPLAKLSAPRLGKIYPCERLHRSLAHACECPMVWITGAPGAGKTTLVAG